MLSTANRHVTAPSSQFSALTQMLQCWTFKHPFFQKNNLDGLENVKRKVPPKKSTSTAAAPKRGTSSTPPSLEEALAERVDSITRSQEDLRAVVERLDENYQTVLRELVAVQRTVANQETIMQQLVHQLIVQNGPPRRPVSRHCSQYQLSQGRPPNSVRCDAAF